MNAGLLIGAGKIGQAIAHYLSMQGYELVVVDENEQCLKDLVNLKGISTINSPIGNENELWQLLANKRFVVSAAPFYKNKMIARIALQAGVSYFDLTEDVETIKYIENLSKEARPGQFFIPACGLAPGFITILGKSVADKFDTIFELKLRTGALPLYPTNQLKYNLTWSTDGLINQYCNTCEAIHEGEIVYLPALGDLEFFTLDGIEYEAFNTSGGLGTLVHTLKGSVHKLDYKSIRYPGHQKYMHFLLSELQMEHTENRKILKEIMEASIPGTKQDLCLVFVSANGLRNGKLEQISDVRKIRNQEINKFHWGAIQISTAMSVCAVIDLFSKNKFVGKGLVKQENINLEDFLQTPFGVYFKAGL